MFHVPGGPGTLAGCVDDHEDVAAVAAQGDGIGVDVVDHEVVEGCSLDLSDFGVAEDAEEEARKQEDWNQRKNLSAYIFFFYKINLR